MAPITVFRIQVVLIGALLLAGSVVWVGSVPETEPPEPSLYGTLAIRPSENWSVGYYTSPQSDVAVYEPPDTFAFVDFRNELLWEARTLDGGVLMRFFKCSPVDAGVFWCPQDVEVR